MLKKNLIIGFLFVSLNLVADLRVFPLRISLSPTQKVAQVTVKHIGTEPSVYKMSVVFFRMKEDGALVEVTDFTPEERAAVNFIKFSPRQVSLEPNVEQVVRVMAVAPNNLPPGDYRAHVRFEPQGTPTNSKKTEPSKGINMKLSMKISVAVPIFYRTGNSTVKLSLQSPQIVRQKDASFMIESDLLYEGTAFPYGDLYTYWVDKDRKQTQIGLTKGISSYIPKRKLRFPLEIPEGISLKDGSLKLEFKNPEDEGGAVLASIEAPTTTSLTH